MTTIERPTDDMALEARLRSWMQTDASAASIDLSELREDLWFSTRNAAQRPRLLVSRGNARSLGSSGGLVLTRRSLLAVAAVLLLALAIATAALVGSRLLHRAPSIPGVFVAGPGLPTEMGYLVRPGVAVLADGRVLVAGGGQEHPLAVVYDPTSGTYGAPIPLPAMHQGATATTLRDGRVLIVGGNDGMTGAVLPNASIFDPSAGRAGPTGTMSFPRDHHTATLLDDGRVLVVGGDVPTQTTDGTSTSVTVRTAELYDPATGTFTETGALAQGRAGHTATKLADGRVVIIGGYAPEEPGGMAAAAEVFDPKTGTFTTLGSLDDARAEHIAESLPDGRILAAGGRTDYGPDGYSFSYLSSAEILDPSTGTFQPAGALVSARADAATAILADGRVMVMGGSNQFGNTRSVEIFDPDDRTFRVVDTVPTLAPASQAVILPDGRIFLTASGQDPGSEAVTFEPGAERVAAAPSARRTSDGPNRAVDGATLRSGGTATLLADGRVLLAGGRGGPLNEPLSSAEIFDPSTGGITPTGAMLAAREMHVAVRLPDGRVVVIGGGDAEPWTEIYDPAAGGFAPASPALAAAIAGKNPFVLQGLTDGRVGIDMSAGGRGANHTIRLVDLATGQSRGDIAACYWRGGAAALANGSIIEGCGADLGTMIYDPTTGTSRTVEQFRGEFWNPLPLADGRVLGQTTKGGDTTAVYFSATQVYDPRTDRVTDIEAPGSTAPMSGTIAQLSDGRLLLVGGNQGNVSDAMWLLDPNTWQYTDAGHLLTPRADPTVTVLPDGRLLVAGGAVHPADRQDPVPPGAEIIDPKDLPASR